MNRKSIDIIPPRELSTAAGRTQLSVPVPAITPLVRVGGPVNALLMRWSAQREAKTYRAMAESTRVQTDYVVARGELARSLLNTARVVAELKELPDVLEHDAQMRQLRRDAELATVQREAAEARYGRDATLEEIATLRIKQRKKTAAKEQVAFNALVKAKQELEALGRDTAAIDDAMAGIGHTNGAGV